MFCCQSYKFWSPVTKLSCCCITCQVVILSVLLLVVSTLNDLHIAMLGYSITCFVAGRVAPGPALLPGTPLCSTWNKSPARQGYHRNRSHSYRASLTCPHENDGPLSSMTSCSYSLQRDYLWIESTLKQVHITQIEYNDQNQFIKRYKPVK